MIFVACSPDEEGSGATPEGGNGTTPPVVEVVNPNLIEMINPGFEEDLAGWTVKRDAKGSKATVEIVDIAGLVKGASKGENSHRS